MSNFGEAGNLVIGGKHIDTREESLPTLEGSKDQGSIIMQTATLGYFFSSNNLLRYSSKALISLVILSLLSDLAQ